jgi:hypothetical protein
MPNASTPCGRATLEMALWLFQEWPAHTAGGLRPSSTPLDNPRCMPMPFFGCEIPLSSSDRVKQNSLRTFCVTFYTEFEEKIIYFSAPFFNYYFFYPCYQAIYEKLTYLL